MVVSLSDLEVYLKFQLQQHVLLRLGFQTRCNFNYPKN